ncbi:MAG: hypothetical protein K2K05_01895 [Muribaculaceae bacterium]|nr:hypothetical protein [Muribaculaceae bacterium]
MKIRPLPLILLFSLLIPLLSLAEEYVLRQSHMREVTPVELKSTCDTDSTEIYYVSSAPLTDRDYPTIVYDYPDSAIVSDYGFLTTFKKCGDVSREL